MPYISGWIHFRMERVYLVSFFLISIKDTCRTERVYLVSFFLISVKDTSEVSVQDLGLDV